MAAVARPEGYSILLDGVPFDLVVEDRLRPRAIVGGKSATRARAELRAPMPGLVVRIDVAEGEHVDAGQRLLVLEAMKMENDLPAPRAGRVSNLAVTAGQTVEMGQILLRLTNA
ncbi:MAG TPA: acetyl-CoA carboxylase biotin carboxyl carrier protein subunit [Chloroflexota bacterium]|nr:acetyl-CoA carboxylase biotin carboxyl carrier protein subunit [Chloroflexota bacterium]